MPNQQIATLLSFAMLALLIAGPCVPGCGVGPALYDSQVARAKADDVNITNWEKETAVQIAFVDKQAAGAESRFLADVAASPTGADAAAKAAEFLAAQKRTAAARQVKVDAFAKALDNAHFQAELTARQTQLLLGWEMLFKTLPGVDALQAFADQKTRDFVNDAAGVTPGNAVTPAPVAQQPPIPPTGAPPTTLTGEPTPAPVHYIDEQEYR